VPERADHIQHITGAPVRQPDQTALRRLEQQADLPERRLGRSNEQRPAQQRIVAALLGTAH
jgi:hypothetical protein